MTIEDKTEVAIRPRAEPKASSAHQDVPTKDLGTESGSTELSTNALKKLAKSKEKEEKKAAKKREQEQKLKEQETNTPDFARDNYGDIPEPRSRPTNLKGLNDISAEEEVAVQARLQNTRAQTAKLVFLLLREGFSTLQAVVAAGDEAQQVSRQMAKWVASLNIESIVEVYGVVKKPKDPVSSATISGLELHVKKIYVIAAAAAQFPMQLESALLPELREDEEADPSGLEDSKTSKTPKVSLKTRLDNRVVDLRTPTNAAITWIKHGVSQLFQGFLRERGFVQIFTPKLMAAASEGGSNVFAVKYFERSAYLAQSPQLHKQMAIGGDCGRVFEIGPVFRAENSNTHRHMTEVSVAWPDSTRVSQTLIMAMSIWFRVQI